MIESRASRGLPIPSAGQIVVIAAALVAAWLVYGKSGRQSVNFDEVVSGNPFESLHALEAHLRQEVDPVPSLLLALDSRIAKERKLAACGLGQIGPAAVQALDKLRERLTDENGQVRADAACAFVRISRDKESAAATIAPLLADHESAVCESVATALVDIGPRDVKPLIEMLRGGSPATRLEVVRVLLRMHTPFNGRRMPVKIMAAVRKSLLEILEGDQPAMRLDAMQMLQYVPPGTHQWKSLQVDLRIAFDDPDPEVRIEAVAAAAAWGKARPAQLRKLLRDPLRCSTAFAALGTLGDETAELLPDVLLLLDDQTAFARIRRREPRSTPERLQTVLTALASMKTGARPATERLVQIGNARGDYACLSIAETLHAIGADEDKIGRVLAPLLLDPDPSRDLNGSAGRLLVKLCPGEARRQVSLLIPRLGSIDTSVDKSVLYALYALGAQAQDAVPAVVPLLHHLDSWVVESAAHLLGETGIGSSDVIDTLVQVVGNKSKPIEERITCADTLATMGPLAKSAVPGLLEVIAESELVAPLTGTPNSRHPRIRVAVFKAIGRIGRDDEGVISVLRSNLASRSPDVRVAAADALGRVGGRSPEALADLIRRLRDDDTGVRAMAAAAIGRMATDRTSAEQQHAVVALTNALADEHSYVRGSAASSLARFSSVARTALPALRELLAAELNRPPSIAYSQRPVSLAQFSGVDGITVFSVPQKVEAAIERIESTPQDK